MGDPKYMQRRADQLIAQGRIIEAGWFGFRLTAIHPSASAEQVEMQRETFFAGCQHLFSTILTVLDPGEEPTEADHSRMEMIDAELKNFVEQFKLKHLPSEGRG